MDSKERSYLTTLKHLLQSFDEAIYSGLILGLMDFCGFWHLVNNWQLLIAN